MQYQPDAMGVSTSQLASPWARLAAWLIDLLIYFVVGIIAGIVGFLLFAPDFGALTGSESDFLSFLGSIIAFIVLMALSTLAVFIVQMVLLGTRGQTVGKIALKIRVVDVQTGEHPGWARLILLRTIVNGLIIGVLNAIPVVGQGLGGAYFLVDSLFIFRADHRTIHDMIAGTQVDKV